MHKLHSVLFTIIFVAFFSCKEKSEVKNYIGKPNIDSLTKSKNPYIQEDQSWLDMSWYPVDYPIEKMKGNDSLHLIVAGDQRGRLSAASALGGCGCSPG